MFGVEPSIARTEIDRDALQTESEPARGLARMKARQRNRECEQHGEIQDAPERTPSRQASVWDALDGIGREQASPYGPSTTSDAMKRVQNRTTEQQQDREREAAEVERERLKHERAEHEKSIEIGYEF